MKILTNKQVDEILKRITANEISAIEYAKDISEYTKNIEIYEHFIKNNAEIAFLVGGIRGMNKILNTIKQRYQKIGD